jgi:uncharacterized protein
MMNYRILALDGGGTWSVIQVKALIKLYDANTTGQTVLRDFDLVAASSGGSVVLGGLVEDLTLAALLDLFEDQTKLRSIFPPTHSLFDKLLQFLAGFGPKYSAKDKLTGLQNVFPERSILALTTVVNGIRRPGSGEDLHLLITGFDYDRLRAAFFRSSPASGPAWGEGEPADVTLAEAIDASTNAPVNFFDAPATFPDRPGRYWDGGVSGCNNPVLAGVSEAIAKYQDPTNLAVLSIGTASVVLPLPLPGQPPSPFVRKFDKPGFLTDLRKAGLSILDDPPDIATYLAHLMTGSGSGITNPAADSRIVRMSPLVSPVLVAGEWSAPGSMTADQFAYLADLDIDALEQVQIDAITNYADLWLQSVALNQPIRMNGDTLTRELGQSTFADALAAWNAIK